MNGGGGGFCVPADIVPYAHTHTHILMVIVFRTKVRIGDIIVDGVLERVRQGTWPQNRNNAAYLFRIKRAIE